MPGPACHGDADAFAVTIAVALTVALAIAVPLTVALGEFEQREPESLHRG